MRADEAARTPRRLVPVEYVAECFWPGVTHDELAALDHRIRENLSHTKRRSPSVRYLGAMLLPSDEVVFCFFEGPLESVRAIASRAEIPFERILEAVRVKAS